MKKFKLDAESLEVETFTTKDQPTVRGTVHGQGDSTYGTACYPYCGNGDSGNYTCECTQGNVQTECRDCEI